MASYTPRKIYAGLRRHPDILQRIRAAIQNSVRDDRERGFLILNDWTPTPTVIGGYDGISGEISLGENPKTLASFHTHVPTKGEMSSADLICSISDAATMWRYNEPAMIIGGRHAQAGFYGYAIAIYTRGENFNQLSDALKRHGEENRNIHQIFYSLIGHGLFNRAIVPVRESDIRTRKLIIIREGPF